MKSLKLYLDKLVNESVSKSISSFLINEIGYFNSTRTVPHTWTAYFYAEEFGGVVGDGIIVNEPIGVSDEEWEKIENEVGSKAYYNIYRQIDNKLREKYPGFRNIRAIRRNK